MGSGVIFFIFLIVIAAFCICGFIYAFAGLIYNHIEEQTFEPKLFWLSIGFLILTVWGIFSIVDCVKYLLSIGYTEENGYFKKGQKYYHICQCGGTSNSRIYKVL